MQDISPIFYIIVLIISVVAHELAHGYAALFFGDNTAKYQGRLTLNPIKHLDLFGSVLLPLMLILTKVPFLIGWAKPVPYNPANFKQEEKTKAIFWVASAGILTNLVIATFFGLFIRVYYSFFGADPVVISLLSVVVLVNIVLALFNLIPIYPLDGSKILFNFLPRKFTKVELFFQKYSLFLMLFFIFFLWKYITPLIFLIFKVLTGLS